MKIVMTDYPAISLINDMVNIIKVRAADSQIQFGVKASSNIPRVLRGDEIRIRQAVLNVLGNAVKYTSEGYVTLEIYSQPIVEDDINPESKYFIYLVFKVTDTGIGIKSEDFETIFGDFTQVDTENNRNIEGVGLGLAITRDIINAMGGSIDVESEYGIGSTFTITVPQKRLTSDPLVSIENPTGKNVLVYEKNDMYAETVIYALDTLGAGCTRVSNKAKLREKLTSGKFGYLFISYELFLKNEDIIKELGANLEIAVLSDFGETHTYGESDPDFDSIRAKNITVLTMPVYCPVVADFLSGTYENVAYADNMESPVRFTAPDARILIVDDIKTNLKVAEGLLMPYGMHIDLADSGAAAIEAVRHMGTLRRKRYDMIFMDHKMPGIDGVEATRQIRQLENGDIPIVALTANAVVDMEELFLASGFNDFLSKPIDLAKLNTVLEKWIPKEKQKPKKAPHNKA